MTQEELDAIVRDHGLCPHWAVWPNYEGPDGVRIIGPDNASPGLFVEAEKTFATMSEPKTIKWKATVYAPGKYQRTIAFQSPGHPTIESAMLAAEMAAIELAL